ncbi:MAG: MarR family transcriptional regulator [Spirochaetales bacterium]|nr:MAG: MarR family transcriptional regulator [Spirochaetales bacterium]
MNGKELEERSFIEDIAMFCEKMGLPRMAGRVLGMLLISEPPSQSLNDICERLQASKSSVSTMARLLVGEGLIEPAPCLMPRRDYFKFRNGGWLEFMRRRMETMAALHAIADRGLELLDGKDESLKERLEEAHAVFEFVDSEFHGWLYRMEQRGRRKS